MQEKETKACPFCGEEILASAIKCKHCGSFLNKTNDVEISADKEKSFGSTLVLAFFFGILGAHRFYTGYKKIGVIQLVLSLSIVGFLVSFVWSFVDIFSIVLGKYRTVDNKELVNYNKTTAIVIGVLAALLFIFNSINGIIGFVKFDGGSHIFPKMENLVKDANSQDSDYEGNEPSTVYKFLNDNYNQIVLFNDFNTGAPTYAVRVQTDLDIGAIDGSTFNYELGRIIINQKDYSDSKCSYNFRAALNQLPVKWIKCSEGQFIKSIPEIAKLKAAEFNKLRPIYEEGNLMDACATKGFQVSPECEKIPYENWDDEYYEILGIKLKNQLMKLRNTTL